MAIRSVRIAVAELENQTLKTSYGSNVTRRRHLFVAVEDSNGVIGYGEGSPLPHFSGERAQEMASVTREVFGPALRGIDPFDVEAAHLALEQALPEHHASKAALINAIHDLQGRIADLPVHAFLGGKLRDRIPIGGAVGIEEPDEVEARVCALWDSGIRTVKFKVGANIDRDIAVIRMLRERFPAELQIRADANSGFTLPEAQRFLRAVADCRLQYLEQPLRGWDWRGLAQLRQFGTPIAADESLFGVSDALGLVVAGAVDVLIVKLIKLGGLHQARKVVAIAEAAGLACVAVSPYETALGVAANLHLAAGSRAFPFAAEVGAGVSSVSLDGADEIEVADGHARLPDKPGLGVSIPASLFRAKAAAGVPA